MFIDLILGCTNISYTCSDCKIYYISHMEGNLRNPQVQESKSFSFGVTWDIPNSSGNEL